MPLVEWALTPIGHYWPKEEYASIIVSIIHLDSLCFGDPLVRPPKYTKSCSNCLKGVGNAQYKFSTPWQSRVDSTPGLVFQKKKCWESYHQRSEQNWEHFGYVAIPWFQDDLRIIRPKFEAIIIIINKIYLSHTYNQQWNLFSLFNPSKCTHTWSTWSTLGALRCPGSS